MKDRRHWLYASLALAGGIFGGALSGHVFPRDAEASAQAARELKAQKFLLVDSGGNQRGAFEVADGTAAVTLDDQSGRPRGQFRVGPDGGGAVAFYDQNGVKRVALGESPTGRNGVAMYGNKGRQMASLTVADDNSSSVTLYDPDTGRARLGLGVTATGEPALVLFDENGHDRAEIHVHADGKPGLALADENGKSIAGLPMQELQPIPQE
jgi:hypothetical protein